MRQAQTYWGMSQAGQKKKKKKKRICSIIKECDCRNNLFKGKKGEYYLNYTILPPHWALQLPLPPVPPLLSLCPPSPPTLPSFVLEAHSGKRKQQKSVSYMRGSHCMPLIHGAQHPQIPDDHVVKHIQTRQFSRWQDVILNSLDYLEYWSNYLWGADDF